MKRKSKKTIIILLASGIIAVLLALLLFAVIIPNMQYQQIRSIDIGEVDLSNIEDGVYRGEFSYSQTSYIVDVSISDHKIKSVDVISGGKSEYAKMAEEGIISRVVNNQKIDVDTVAGATTSSKALLRAIETALN